MSNPTDTFAAVRAQALGKAIRDQRERLADQVAGLLADMETLEKINEQLANRVNALVAENSELRSTAVKTPAKRVRSKPLTGAPPQQQQQAQKE